MKTGFPVRRMRRLRQHPGVRRLIRPPWLAPQNLVLPLFVKAGKGLREEIGAMPGNYQVSPDRLADEVREAAELGLGGIILFGIPAAKDSTGSDALSPSGIIPQALAAAREAAPELLRITDVCFCEYTDHGHCGVPSTIGGRTDVANDETVELLGRQAVVHAQAGADMVAPSGMMDGMVGAIRRHLDEADYQHLPIMSYAAKYASAFYGPFREAAESAPHFGDRRSYQMDPEACVGEALREVELDLSEGADIVMVKPALPYLDVIHAISTRLPGVPLAAYHVSGEFSMLKAAAERGWLDEKAAVLESLTSIRRAGAQIILTYWAKDVARWLREG